MIKLRQYQTEAIGAAFSAWAAGVRRPALVLATGLGKTVIFAALIAEWLRLHPGRQVLVLAHRDELVEQAVRKLHAVAPHLRVGVVKGARDEVAAEVVVGSVMTLAREPRRARLRRVGLIVVDECHHATAASYTAILSHFGALGDERPGGAVALGVTATMERADGVALGQVWDEVVFERDIQFGIKNGFLVDVRGIRIKVKDLDLSRVRRSGGDYAEGALGQALEDSLAPTAIARAYAEHAPGRQGILFAPTVHSAEVLGNALRDVAGIESALIHGMQPLDERRAALADFERGGIQVLTNCMVLTEGTDLPPAAVAAIARPTTSASLYVQMVGRVLRPHPGKRGALVLDLAGVSGKATLASLVNLLGDESAVTDVELEQVVDEDGQLLDEFSWTDPSDKPTGGAGVDDIGTADGPLVWEEVSLFGESRSNWLRTRAGVWFLPAGDRLIALLPSPVVGAWDVVAMHRYQAGQSEWVIRGVDDMGYAMAHAEGAVTEQEHLTALRERSWRKRKPTERALGYAAQLGIADFVGTGGELSDEIARRQATRRIDHRIPPYAWDRLASLAGV